MCGGGGLKLWRVLSVVVITIDNTMLLDTTMPESDTLGVLCDIYVLEKSESCATVLMVHVVKAVRTATHTPH